MGIKEKLELKQQQNAQLEQRHTERLHENQKIVDEAVRELREMGYSLKTNGAPGDSVTVDYGGQFAFWATTSGIRVRGPFRQDSTLCHTVDSFHRAIAEILA